MYLCKFLITQPLPCKTFGKLRYIIVNSALALATLLGQTAHIFTTITREAFEEFAKIHNNHPYEMLSQNFHKLHIHPHVRKSACHIVTLFAWNFRPSRLPPCAAYLSSKVASLKCYTRTPKEAKLAKTLCPTVALVILTFLINFNYQLHTYVYIIYISSYIQIFGTWRNFYVAAAIA